MILIAGIPTEAPTARAIEAAEEVGIAHAVFDQRSHAASDLILDFDPFAGWQGRLAGPHGSIDLGAVRGIYVRLMDDRFLPDADPDSHPTVEATGRRSGFHDLLREWLDIAPGRIASRPKAMLSNMSKTYQAGLIRAAGFAIPETLVTNDPDQALAFVASCAADGDDVIYKSISGTRSIVQTFAVADRARIGRIRWCPTQFQRKIRGVDIRVHVVGNRVFATRIASTATDYRYAIRQSGEDAELSATELPPEVSQACVALSASLALPFTGIDLRQRPDGGFVCFEANPCPAYSYYEARTGAPIARALVCWLAGLDDTL